MLKEISFRLQSRVGRGSGILGGFADAKIGAVWMMEYQGTDTGLRIHHEPLGQLHADFLRPQQLPDARLVFEIGARRIPEAVALAAIA